MELCMVLVGPTLVDGTKEYPGTMSPALLIRTTDLAKEGQKQARIETK